MSLVKFCKKHELDVMLIDREITFGENKTFLDSLVPRDTEELAEEYGRIYTIMEEEIPQVETYGVDLLKYEASAVEVQMVRMYAVYTYKLFRVRTHQKLTFKPKRTYLDVIRGYIDVCFKCPFQWCKSRVNLNVSRTVITVKGTVTAVATIQTILLEHGIRYRTVKLKRMDKHLQWIGGFGFVKPTL